MFAIRPALVLLFSFTLLTGAVYPALVTATVQWLLPKQANGSLIERAGKIAGSRLIGQPFSDPRYFWSRPSATAPVPYNASASSGSNQGPLHPALAEAVQQRVAALREADPHNYAPVPVDLVTASASGLDPHISPAAARYQVGRVAQARGIAKAVVEALVEQHTEGRDLGLLGEARVNVLELNLALDALR
ncbi:MAG TPA: potassium-transporting ATPase subunit KdpC [Polyangiales bacterium]|nr:potassium-transporting ATPase subunit KdpC [Polyangiales bacterium]